MAQDGQVCFHRRLFADPVKPQRCTTEPVRPLDGINKDVGGSKLMLTTTSVYRVDCTCICPLLKTQHHCLCPNGKCDPVKPQRCTTEPVRPLDGINKDVGGSKLLLTTTSVYRVDCTCICPLLKTQHHCLCPNGKCDPVKPQRCTTEPVRPLDGINKDVGGSKLLLTTTSVYRVDCTCICPLLKTQHHCLCPNGKCDPVKPQRCTTEPVRPLDGINKDVGGSKLLLTTTSVYRVDCTCICPLLKTQHHCLCPNGKCDPVKPQRCTTEPVRPLDGINKDVGGSKLLLTTTSVYRVDCTCICPLLKTQHHCLCPNGKCNPPSASHPPPPPPHPPLARPPPYRRHS